MKPSEVFAQHRDTIRRIVLESGMTNPRLFGSALHGDDIDGSDLDILIDPSQETSLLDLVALQMQIEDALSIKVDVLTPNSLPPKFRDAVLAEAAKI
jgi:hypothetical protein